jgi:hypothetical protein
VRNLGNHNIRSNIVSLSNVYALVIVMDVIEKSLLQQNDGSFNRCKQDGVSER